MIGKRSVMSAMVAPVAACLAFSLLGLLAFVGPRMYYWHRVRELQKTDQRALLAACRALISQYHSEHATELQKLGQFPADADKVPAIKALRPKYVTVHDEYVLICMNVIPRLYVLAFAEGSPQFGRGILQDGLRFSSDPGDLDDLARPQTPKERANRSQATFSNCYEPR